jgi:hypothetical protein
VHEPNEEIGYKIYGKNYHHVHDFTHAPYTYKDLNIEHQCEIVKDEELQELYDYLNFLYHQGCYPKVHRIFNYGSITGIVHTKCSPDKLSDSDWDNRKELMGEGYELLSQHNQRQGSHQWGYTEGRVVILDFDYHDFWALTQRDYLNRKRLEESKEI